MMKSQNPMSVWTRSKAFFAFSSVILVVFLQLSFAFAEKHPTHGMSSHPVSFSSVSDSARTSSLVSVYDSLHLDELGLPKAAFSMAIKGFEKLADQGRLENDDVMTIVDFSKPSSKKRLYIIDLKNYKVIFNTYVAHGRNSGKEMANSFSNIHSSYQSSLGFYVTGQTYMGGNGYSLRLKGLEKGINDEAMARAIVIHGANYVSRSILEAQGYLGRSFGCPAVSQKEARPIINSIKDGSCLFIYSPDKNYSKRSTILNS